MYVYICNMCFVHSAFIPLFNRKPELDSSNFSAFIQMKFRPREIAILLLASCNVHT